MGTVKSVGTATPAPTPASRFSGPSEHSQASGCNFMVGGSRLAGQMWFGILMEVSGKKQN